MLSAQLRQEVSRPAGVPIDAAKVRSLCRRQPGGAIVDNKMRARVWAALLLDGQAPPPLPDIKDAKMDAEDARVVEADVKRTRGYLPIFQDEATGRLMRSLLTTHCLASGMKYKQGLHELLAPFVALSPDPPVAPLAPELVYALFQAFISRYMGPFFRDDGMDAVRQGFGLFNLLLQYHDPELAGHLHREGFPPELYATPYFLTLFAHNLELYLVHRLWDNYIALDDPTLVYYLALGLLTLRRDLLLHADAGELPEVVSQIKLRCPEDIAAVLRTALEARRQTPLSFTRDLQRAAATTTSSIPTEEEEEVEQGTTIDGWEARKGLPPLNFHATAFAAASRGGQGVIEVSAAELVRSWLASEEAKQEQEQREHAAGPSFSLPASPLPALHKLGLGSNGGDTPGRGPAAVSPSSPSKSAHGVDDATEAAEAVAGALPPPISYVVLDARSHEEFHSSGAGVLRGALRLDPQVAFRSRDGLDAWLRLHDLFPSAHAQGEESEKEGGGPKAAAPAVVHHICVVGSRIRRRKQGEEPDSLWRRLLLGEGDEDEAVVAAAAAATSSEGGEPAEGPGGAGEDKAAATTLYADTGDALVRALRARGHARVSKLRGGVDALIDLLALCYGPGSIGLKDDGGGGGGGGGGLGFVVTGRLFPPVVERHDAMAWERWRRRHFGLSKLPPAFYTTTGLQRPMVLPSEKEGASARHHQYERPDAAFPCKRLRPEAMAELAEALEIADQHGHAGAAGALREAIHRQKEMIRLGIGEDEEESEEEGGQAVRVWSARPPVPALPTPVSLPSLLPLKSPLTTSASASASVVGGSVGGSRQGAGGGKQQQLMGKAQQLLDKADTWMSGVVMRGRAAAPGGGGGGNGQQQQQGAEDGARELLDG